ncbi:MAG TPA: hypothetical protein VGW37_06970, partial [Terriglobia bacterium]|nr:hypothetical protein [Terriglobia bacterium]
TREAAGKAIGVENRRNPQPDASNSAEAEKSKQVPIDQGIQLLVIGYHHKSWLGRNAARIDRPVRDASCALHSADAGSGALVEGPAGGGERREEGEQPPEDEDASPLGRKASA